MDSRLLSFMGPMPFFIPSAGPFFRSHVSALIWSSFTSTHMRWIPWLRLAASVDGQPELEDMRSGNVYTEWMLCESYAIAIDLLFLIIACIGLSNWLHFPVLWQEMLRIWAFLSWIPNDTVTFFFHIGVLKKLCIGHPPAIILVGGPSCLTRCATTDNTTSKACRTLLNRASPRAEVDDMHLLYVWLAACPQHLPGRV